MVADSLSRLVGDPPIISLWPRYFPKNAPDRFDNALNSFDLREICDVQMRSRNFRGNNWNALIVDDACKSGNSLQDARKFVQWKLRGIEHEHHIKTAALEVYSEVDVEDMPDFFVTIASKSRNIRGEEE